MKKIVLFIFLFLLGINYVNADTNVYSIDFVNSPLATDSSGSVYWSTGFMRGGYPAVINYSGGNSVSSVGFCLDPGREFSYSIVNSTVADNSYYYPYLYFYNNLLYATYNSGASSSEITDEIRKQKAAFLAAVRSINPIYCNSSTHKISNCYNSCMEGIKNNSGAISGCYSSFQADLIKEYYNASSHSDMINWANSFKKPNLVFQKKDTSDENFKEYVFNFNWDDML